MARIQKKKITSRFKRKPETEEPAAQAGTSSPMHGDGGTTVAAPAVSEAGMEKRKKKIPVQGTAEPSMVLKLADKYFGNWIQFLREVKVELTKVTWPSKQQTIGSTAVVIVFVFIISIFLGVVDLGLSSLVRLIL